MKKETTAVKKMNRTDFIAYLAMQNDLSHEDAEKLIYDAFVKGVITALEDGNYIALAGFGNFYVQEHKGHPVQFTDDKSEIENYYVLKFSAGQKVKKHFRVAKIK